MTELTLEKVKKVQILLFVVVIVLILFGGCGTQEPGGEVRLEDLEVPMSGGVDINAIGTGEWAEAQNLDGAGGVNGSASGTESKMELNPDETTVIYQGTAFMSSCRTIGGDSIYSTGYLGEFDGEHPAEGSYFAGRIGLGEDAVQQYGLEIPEDMFAYRGCIDSQGRWHLLLTQKTEDTMAGQKAEIWVINKEGELEHSIDITESVKDGLRIPMWMTVDRQGNYYFASGGSILVIDVGNPSVGRLYFDGDIAGIGIGRSGALYGVFDEDGRDFLGIVDIADGSIEKCADFPESRVRPSFSVLQAGVETELLLANKGEGIWSYDGAELKLERTLENIVANGQDILAMGFLWDGRACVMDYQDGKYVFHYVPIES